ncbi:MAG: REP-associated tyrosine transposase [Candidatus Sumerlaeia bacterium]
MYEYRKLSKKQRAELLYQRRKREHPLHAPPHFAEADGFHLISAACYEHQAFLKSSARRDFFEEQLLSFLTEVPEADVRAWVILPNHYHLLVSIRMALLGPLLNRLHSGTATQWNREDSTQGRKVWHRYSDRKIRSERHFYATVNYIHGNPVKHGWVQDASLWDWSSLPIWMGEYGRDCLVKQWKDYPVDGYGEGWDD